MVTPLQVLREALKTNESRFASFTYTNSHGETSRYLVHLNVNYAKVVANDLKIAKRFRPSNDIERQAKEAIVASLTETVTTGKNSNYTLEGVFEHLSPAVKYNDRGELFIDAFIVRKDVIVPGEYPHVNHRPLTVAKSIINDKLKKNKFRTFKLDINNLHGAKLNGKTIELSF